MTLKPDCISQDVDFLPHCNFCLQAFEGVELEPPLYDDNLLSMLEYGADPKEMDQAGADWRSSSHQFNETALKLSTSF